MRAQRSHALNGGQLAASFILGNRFFLHRSKEPPLRSNSVFFRVVWCLMRATLTDPVVVDYLLRADPKLKRLFDEVDPANFELSPKSVYCALVGAVLGQKIRFSKARALRGKVYELMGGTVFEPIDTAALPNEHFRALGMDARQLEIMRKVEAWCLTHEGWDTNEGLAKMQQCVKGIGPWTVQVVKLTALTDLDIFPTNDVFINERLKRLYDLPKRPSGYEIQKLAEPWTPYRSVVCWWLWRWQM